MSSADVSQNDRKLLRIIVWTSTIAVAGSLALMFGVDTSGGRMHYGFNLASFIALVVSLVVMRFFWKRVFALLDQPTRLWRFILISSVLMVVLFMAMIFLPQFRPIGTNSGDLLQGMILGFLAVAAVFWAARKVMRLLEGEEEEDKQGTN